MKTITQEELESLLYIYKQFLVNNSLEKVDFSRLDLTHKDFERVDLSFSNFNSTDLSWSNLKYSKFIWANFNSADLSNTDFTGADLSCADLRGANLTGAVLTGANFKNADLTGANLTDADLTCADLTCADLFGIHTRKNLYQINCVGSENRLVSYFLKEDMVVCGCWSCDRGNTLENFKKRVESIYGKNGKNPNEQFYQEYQFVIDFFDKIKKFNKG